MSRDPIGFIGGINIYEYCNSNSMCGNDPMGLWNLACIKKIAEMIGKVFDSVMINKDGSIRYTLDGKIKMNKGLYTQIEKYDPVADGLGIGFNHYNGKKVKPGNHYNNITNLQRRLKEDIEWYNKNCRDDKDPPCPKIIASPLLAWMESVVNMQIPKPIKPITLSDDEDTANSRNFKGIYVPDKVIIGVAGVTAAGVIIFFVPESLPVVGRAIKPILEGALDGGIVYAH